MTADIADVTFVLTKQPQRNTGESGLFDRPTIGYCNSGRRKVTLVLISGAQDPEAYRCCATAPSF